MKLILGVIGGILLLFAIVSFFFNPLVGIFLLLLCILIGMAGKSS